MDTWSNQIARRAFTLAALGVALLPAATGCSPETEPTANHGRVGHIPPLPPLPAGEQGQSVHPTDLPPAPPPDWAKEKAYLEARDGKRVLVASGSATDAGNHPDAAFAKAEKRARAKLEAWRAENEVEGRPSGRAQIVQNWIGTDGRAYVRLEAELPKDG